MGGSQDSIRRRQQERSLPSEQRHHAVALVCASSTPLAERNGERRAAVNGVVKGGEAGENSSAAVSRTDKLTGVSDIDRSARAARSGSIW